MRKGRSSRRSKVSRPSIPVDSARSPKSADAVAGGAGPGPRVVLGIARPSEPPAAERDARLEVRGDAPEAGDREEAPAIEARGDASGASAAGLGVAVAGATLEALEADTSTVGADEEIPATESSPPTMIAATTDPPPSAPPSAPPSSGKGSSKSKRKRAKLEAQRREAAAREAAERDAAARPVVAAERVAEAEPPISADEISIPPVGDLVVEEFFSEGDVGKHLAGEPELDEPVVDQKIVRKRAPEVVERRNRFARYVRWAVGSAAVVCVAAAVRAWAAPHATALEGAHAANAVVAIADAPVAKEAPVAPPATPEAVAVPPAPAPETAPPVETAAAPVDPAQAAPTDAPKAEPSTADAPKADLDPKSAAIEKNAARRALEGGKLGAAIEAGERSVALDPTDGEAWLLLGAAYQEKGRAVDARRCYTACVKQGKRGPLNECTAMLR